MKNKKQATKLEWKDSEKNSNNISLIIVAEVPSVTPPILESGQRCLRIVKILHHHLIMMTTLIMMKMMSSRHQFPIIMIGMTILNLRSFEAQLSGLLRTKLLSSGRLYHLDILVACHNHLRRKKLVDQNHLRIFSVGHYNLRRNVSWSMVIIIWEEIEKTIQNQLSKLLSSGWLNCLHIDCLSSIFQYKY